MEMLIGLIVTVVLAGVALWYSWRLSKKSAEAANREARLSFSNEVVALGLLTDPLVASTSDERLKAAMREARRLIATAKSRGWKDAEALVWYAGLVRADSRDARRRHSARERVQLVETWRTLPELCAQWVDDPAAVKVSVLRQGTSLTEKNWFSDSIENIKQWHHEV